MIHFVYETFLKSDPSKNYIGKHTTENLEDGYLGSGLKLLDGIQKRGKEAYDRKILSFHDTGEEASEVERHFVDVWKPYYNIAEGGYGGDMLKYASEEKKAERSRKISESKRGENNPNWGKKHSEETKQKISEALKGENNPMWGKKLSEETKQKISESNKGKTHSEETKQRMSQLKKGEKNPNWGKKHSEETRKNMSESKKGENNPMSRTNRLRRAEKKKQEKGVWL